jgi:hypothetical protein
MMDFRRKQNGHPIPSKHLRFRDEEKLYTNEAGDVCP